MRGNAPPLLLKKAEDWLMIMENSRCNLVSNVKESDLMEHHDVVIVGSGLAQGQLSELSFSSSYEVFQFMLHKIRRSNRELVHV